MEIERKWMMESIPPWADEYPCRDIVQGYICTDPTVRVRRDGSDYVLTIKGRGLMAREEYELSIDKEGFEKLLKKCDGLLIEKKRYRIPVDAYGQRLGAGTAGTYTAEMDVFGGFYEGLIYLEVEFADENQALSFAAPEWFGKEVTGLRGYSNGDLAMGIKPLKTMR